MHYRAFVGLVIVVCTALSAGAGRSHKTAVATGYQDKLSQLVEWVDSFSLEENDAVINVSPIVRVDWAGGFLVADGREAQLRRYGERGNLLSAWSRRGGGPGEFRRPVALMRLVPTGHLLAVDIRGKLVSFNSAVFPELIRTSRTPLIRITDAEPINDSVLLLAGLTEHESARLHLWDLRGNRIMRSFHDPWQGSPHVEVAGLVGWTKAAVRRDTIAAIFAPSDTVYYFSSGGKRLGVIPIPFRQFRRPTGAPTAARTNERAQKEWLASFDLVSDIFWLREGLLIRYQTLVSDGVRWHLLLMTPDGRRLFEVRDVPQLLATDSNGDRLYFVSPGSITPNRWSAARVRPKFTRQ